MVDYNYSDFVRDTVPHINRNSSRMTPLAPQTGNYKHCHQTQPSPILPITPPHVVYNSAVFLHLTPNDYLICKTSVIYEQTDKNSAQ